MEAIVHYPSNFENKRVLSEKIAIVHAQAIFKYVSDLPCSKEQKLILLKEIKQSKMN